MRAISMTPRRLYKVDIKLKLQYKGAKTANIQLESEWIEEEDIDDLLEDMLKTGRIAHLTIIDEMGNEWSLKEYDKLKIKMEHEPRAPVIYFDGGFRKATHESGIGVVIYYKIGNVTYRKRSNAKLEELTTNNEAEYAALYHALVQLQHLEIKQLPCTIKGDAQGVLKQLAGEWPCYEEVLNEWLDKIEAKIKDLGIKPAFEIISRQENKEADQLANQALNNQSIDSHHKIESK